MNAMVRWMRSQWDRLTAWSFLGLSGIVLLSAISQAKDNTRVVDQLSIMLSGGVGSLSLAMIGCGLLVLAGFHDQWRKLDRIEDALRSRLAVPTNGRSGTTPNIQRRPAMSRWLRAEWDRLIGGVLVGCAVGAFVQGSRATADALYPAAQVAYLTSAGLGSLVLLTAGVWTLVVADLRDIHYKMHSIENIVQPRVSTVAGVLASTTRRGLIAGTATVAVSMGVMVVGWLKAADALEFDAALGGLVVSTAGLGFAVAALVVVTSLIRNKQTRRISSVLAPAMRKANEASAEVVLDPTTTQPRQFWTADGLHRVHERSCPALLMSGRKARAVQDSAGLEPCLICNPGETANA